MGIQYAKAKSVGKTVTVKGAKLKKTVLDTMSTIADLVGATLGPGGQPVLIERQEHDLPPMVTKDGVTVFRAIGFDDSTAQVVMEAARDASVRTVSEAGDGTTTATILANAIVQRTYEFCEKNREVPAQKVVARLQSVFRDVIEPTIKATAGKADPTTEEGKKRLWTVAKVSANGDEALADAVMECFRLTGDDGNVTITEVNGPSKYEVEKIEGYPVPLGYEDCCAKFAPKFINDHALQRTVLENPAFIVYHGRLTEIQSVQLLLEVIGDAWQARGFRHNIILVATGFSESVLANLAINMDEKTCINVYPLLAPQSAVPNGQLGFLEDICAVTGATMFDPLNKTFDSVLSEGGIGLAALGTWAKTFEANRFRSVIITDNEEPADDDESEAAAAKRARLENMAIEIEGQVQKLRNQVNQSASELDRAIFQERIGKLTGGIAKLRVVGASNGELRERRDRAEDAICAVRGAIKHGCLPGGGVVLLTLAKNIATMKDEILDAVLVPALKAPVRRLFANIGFTEAETDDMIGKLEANLSQVYDAYEGRFVDAWEGGVLDSTPAVLESLRNSISIASLLGTLGGTVVFTRDHEFERKEAHETSSFLRDANYAANPADERAL